MAARRAKSSSCSLWLFPAVESTSGTEASSLAGSSASSASSNMGPQLDADRSGKMGRSWGCRLEGYPAIGAARLQAFLRGAGLHRVDEIEGARPDLGGAAPGLSRRVGRLEGEKSGTSVAAALVSASLSTNRILASPPS